jgi:hypothetical protein
MPYNGGSVPALCSRLRWMLVALCCLVLFCGSICAQQAASVPPLVKFSGTISGAPSGSLGVIFALYKDSSGGAPLWQEVQSVSLDAAGRYTAFLGSRSATGIPVELFSTGEAHWLAVQPQGQPEQPRVLLVSVPYALKASDAETLGGLPASAFLRATTTAPNSYISATAVNSAASRIATAAIVASGASAGYLPVFTDASGDLGSSSFFQAANGYVGIGTTTPAFNLNVISQTDPAAVTVEGYGVVGVNFIGRRARGTPAAPSALLANDNLMAMQGRGYGATSFSPGSRAYMKFFAAENWTDTAQGSYITLATTLKGTAPTTTPAPERVRITDAGWVGIGTTTPAAMLEVNGTVQFDGLVNFATGQTLPGTVTTISSDGSIVVTGTPAAPSLAINTNAIQSRVTGACPAGQALTSVNPDGSVNCNIAVSGPGSAPQFLTLPTIPTVSGIGSYVLTRVVPDQPIAVTKVDLTANTLGSGTCIPAILRVGNGTSYEDVPVVVTTTSYDTSDHALVFPAGATVSVTLAQVGTCLSGQLPQNLVGSIRYRAANSGEPTVCPSGLTLTNGSCVDTNDDLQNCGAAGTACAYLNGTPACFTGSCGGFCNYGYGNCDGNNVNGCETNLTNSLANCGSCGFACSTPNGTPSCVAGACALSSCNVGYGNCDGNAANGCETNITNSIANCGSCGHACALANATPACNTGACAISSCNIGYADCNANAADGCEINLTNDVNNCGKCGTLCPSGSTCSSGTCSCTVNCGTGSSCTTGTSCASKVCSGGFCAAATCSDGVKNGNETDVDCGGGTCAPCATAKACLVASDCINKVCTLNVCAAATCSDGVQNGNETDVDCGGGTCAACANGRVCRISSDCSSKVCSGGVCLVPTCSDGVKNGNETDVDCGGGTCAACATGKACIVGSDCVSGDACVAGVCTVLQAQGAACTLSSQCITGNCADGFCCNTACTATCTACNAALTSSPNGTCGEIRAGTNPKSQCTSPQTCNGSGACQ